MDNEMVKVFENNEFGKVRIVEIDGKPWFVASDVAKALGYSQPHKAIWDHCKGVLKRNIPTNGGIQQMSIIPEGDVYRLIIRSKLPSAERFESWVFDEVLPSIRKTGSYSLPQTLEERVAYGLIAAQEIIKKQEKLLVEKDTTIAQQTQVISELKPKADYTDRILQCKNAVTITQIAKDYGMSGKAMNKKLHEIGVIYKLGGQWLLYSKYQAKGYTRSETVDITLSDGRQDVRMNTKWTQKGRLFLYGILKENGVLPEIEQE